MSNINCAYYAWTDLQLLNILNLKLNQHSLYNAELFILKLERISDEITSMLEQTGFFRIHIIELAEGSKFDISSSHSLTNLVLKAKARKWYKDRFREIIGGRKFDRAVIAGFWAETDIFIEVLLETSPNLKIDFVEEGVRHGSELYSYTLSNNKLVRIYRRLISKKKIDSYKKLCENAYFYAPSRYAMGTDPEEGYNYAELLPADSHNPLFLDCLLKIPIDINVISIYNRCNIIILEDSAFCFENKHGDTLTFWDVIEKNVELFKQDNIIIRKHPSAKAENREIIKPYKNIYYDTCSMPIELILLKVEQQIPGKVNDMVIYYTSSASRHNLGIMFGLYPEWRQFAELA